MSASTGLRSDLIRLAELYGMPGRRVSRIEAGTEGVVFTWIGRATPDGSQPTRETRMIPLGANPPDQPDMGTPIYDQLLRDSRT